MKKQQKQQTESNQIKPSYFEKQNLPEKQVSNEKIFHVVYKTLQEEMNICLQELSLQQREIMKRYNVVNTPDFQSSKLFG